MKAESDDRCPTHLLHDAPAEEDQLGAHGRIADAVADVVLTEPGGHALALAGSYGSGKSTVVRLLGQRLQHDDRVMFVFDTWAHEGDPLRRTFLDRLIARLQDVGWIDKKEWGRIRDELALRQKTEMKRTIPRLTGLGVAFAISLMLSPLGLVLLNEAFRRGMDLHWPGHPAFLGWLGIGLTLGPLLVLGSGLWEGLTKDESGKKRGKLASWSEAGARLGAIIVQKGETEATTSTAETPEPTSVEFESTFGKLMEEALQPANRRLVIVVDNLDRVEPEDALRIWSTLRTFLDPTLSARPSWVEQLWVVIPYDPEGIRRLWKDQEGQLASSFLDKSIQVRFDVPPILLADWRRYLEALWRQALPLHDDELQRVYRLIALVGATPEKAPTPRALKSIVNQIGALHRQRHDIPVHHLAYFALLQRQGRNVPAELREGTLPESRVAALVGEGIVESLAALAYGVDVESGQQLLLGGPILRSLEEGDAAELASFRSRFEHFFTVLDDVVARACESEWGPNEPERLLRAVATLDASGLFDDMPSDERNGMLLHIAHAAVAGVGAVPLDPDARRGFLVLTKRVGDCSITRELVEQLSTPPAADRTLADGELVDFAKAVLDVVTILREQGLASALHGGITVPGDAAALVSVVAVMRQEGAGQEDLQVLRPGQPMPALLKSLEAMIKAGGFRDDHAATLEILDPHLSNTDRKTLIAALGARANGQNGITPEEATALLKALWSFGNAASAEVNRLAREGHLAHHMALFSGSAHVEERAWVYMAYMTAVPTLEQGVSVAQGGTGYNQMQREAANPPKDVVDTLADLFIADGDPTKLFTVLEKASFAEQLTARTLAVIAQRGGQERIFTAGAVAQHWTALRPHLSEAARIQLIERMPEADILSQQLQSQGLQRPKLELYTDLLEARPGDRGLRAWLAKSLQAQSEAVWSQDLANGVGPLTRLALQVGHAGATLDLGQGFRTVLAEKAEASANGQGFPGVDAATLSRLALLLDESNRVVLRDQLAATLMRSKGAPHPLFLNLFGPEAAQARRIRTDPDVATEVFEPILKRRDPVQLQWLRDALVAEPTLLDGLAKEYRDIIRGAVRQGLDQKLSGPLGALFADMAKALRVRPSRSRSEI